MPFGRLRKYHGMTKLKSIIALLSTVSVFGCSPDPEIVELQQIVKETNTIARAILEKEPTPPADLFLSFPETDIIAKGDPIKVYDGLEVDLSSIECTGKHIHKTLLFENGKDGVLLIEPDDYIAYRTQTALTDVEGMVVVNQVKTYYGNDINIAMGGITEPFYKTMMATPICAVDRIGELEISVTRSANGGVVVQSNREDIQSIIDENQL